MSVPALVPTLSAKLMTIPGVQGVALGGSHASGNATPASDIDLSLAYRGDHPFDLAALNALCRELDDSGSAEATPPGGWGPWVDGGAWLTVQGRRVDFIYRDLARVGQSVQDALAGKVALFAQPGHPHGIHAHHYAAEVASCVVLHDPSEELARLKEQVRVYPPALASALQAHYGWQKGFWLDAAAKGLKRQDVHYAQGCAYQAVMALVQERAARLHLWLLNEKGSVERVGGPDMLAAVNAALEPLNLQHLRELLEQWR